MQTSLQKDDASRESILFNLFYDIFWERMPVIDQENYGKAYLLKVAQEAFEFIKKREGMNSSIKIYLQKGIGFEKKFEEESTAILILNNDKPFLIDSTLAELKEKNLSVKFIVYPLFWVKRDTKGDLKDLFKESGKFECKPESLIFIKLNEVISEKQDSEIKKSLEKVYEDVSLSVEDWSLMLWL